MNALLDRAPVLVGVGEITQRTKDPAQALEPLALMEGALCAADEDAGGGLLAGIDSLDVVAEYSWPYPDAPTQLCDRLAITPARRTYGTVGGESPVRFIHEAALRIARGESVIAAVVGAEANYAVAAASKAKVQLPWSPRDPDAKLVRGVDYLHPLAVKLGVATPATVYPFYENAATAAWGQTPREALVESGQSWAGCSRVAAENPYAWQREVLSAEQITTPGPGNRLVAWPYTVRMVANPLVNQGAAVLLMSRGEARRRGLSDDQLVFVWCGAAAKEPADYLLRDQYVRFPDSTVRADFLKAVVSAVFNRLETTELPGPKEIGNILGPMVREGRLQLHSAQPDEQAFFRRIGAAREFPDPAGDFLGVVTQNATGNKIDTFQHRTVHYDAHVDPSTGGLDATATIAVRNDAPSSGLPDYIIGSFPDNPLPRGTSRVLLWVYSPQALQSATLDGQPVDLITQQELGHNVYMARFDVPPGGTRTLALQLRGGVDLRRYDGDYRLKIWRQATVNPDRTRVAVTAPDGWTVEPVKGLHKTPGGAVRGGEQSSLLAVSAAFDRS